MTNKDVDKANSLLEKIFKLKKFPKSPPINTLKNNGQYNKISFNMFSLVNWPSSPEIEFISINNDAVVMIFLGLSAFNKKSRGLKKIPPPNSNYPRN